LLRLEGLDRNTVHLLCQLHPVLHLTTPARATLDRCHQLLLQ
jgi:hypothetical protein